MSDPYDDEKQEEPLDPAMQRVQAKLRRLLFGSSMIMVLGLLAVFAAIVYKLNEPEAPSVAYRVPAVVTEADLRRASYPLPKDARIVGIALDGPTLAVTYQAGEGGGGVLLVDVASWQVFSVLSLPSR